MARLLILAILLVGLIIPPAHAQDTPNELIQPFTHLGGNVSVLVRQDNTDLAHLHAETPLAVASAFKLSVLAVLQQQIEAKKHTWEEVIPLQAQAKSLPSGILQAWPDQTPMTLQTLATLMISISDNTAADQLIQLLGPAELQRQTNKLLLTTRQAFTLKNPANQALLETYRQSDNRLALLPQIDAAPLPHVELVDTVPLATDIEWFFSTRELCEDMETVADLPLMQVNTGIIDPAPWQQVAFKGGSEPGVLNLTAALTSSTDQHYCVSATWNDDQPLSEYAFFQAYTDLIETLSTAS